MARYITLFRFTEQGAKNIKQSTARARAFTQAAQKDGLKVEGLYWTVGACDGVLVLQADDERKALHALTELAGAGNVRTETIRAFDASEFDSIVGG